MYVIVGLGNPTMKYSKTRHNVGFDTIDVLAKRHGIRVKKMEHKALTGVGTINGEKVLLVKPQTYMNNSGEAVRPICDYYKVDVSSELLIISDDLSLDVGTLRLRTKGSAGGHNGLKSIIHHLGTDTFPRLKVGVGNVPEDSDIITHVLSRFSRTDRKIVKDSFEVAADAIECVVGGDMNLAMSRYNGSIL